MSGRVTIKELAARLGLSASTVSRALAGTGRMAGSTRKQVLDLATGLGYRSDPGLRALVAQRRYQRRQAWRLAVLTHPEQDRQRRRGHLHAAVCQQAEGLGYTVTVGDLGQADPGGWCRQRRLQGAIVVGDRGKDHAVLDLAELPTVVVGWRLLTQPVVRVVTDQFADMALAYDRAVGLGAQRIGLLLHEHTDRVGGHRWSGAWLQAQHRHDRVAGELLFPLQHDAAAVATWLAGARPDTVIIVRRPDAAVSAALAGIRLVRLGLLPDEAYAWGVVNDLDQLAAAAVQQLDLLLRNDGRELGADQVLCFPGRWQQPAV